MTRIQDVIVPEVLFLLYTAFFTKNITKKVLYREFSKSSHQLIYCFS
jgi:hypothetical protein